VGQRGRRGRSRRGRFRFRIAKFYPGDHRQLAGIALLDRQTGERLWFRSTDKTLKATPYLGKVRCILGTEAGLEARTLEQGLPVPDWKCDGGPVASEWSCMAKILVYVNSAGEIVLVEMKTGIVKGKRDGIRKGIAPILSRNQALVATQYGLATVSLEPNEAALEQKRTAPRTLVRRRPGTDRADGAGRGLHLCADGENAAWCALAWGRENEPRPVGTLFSRTRCLRLGCQMALGGKGASLKDMTLAGLQVPPGFTIRTDCCETYFEQGGRLA